MKVKIGDVVIEDSDPPSAHDLDPDRQQVTT